MKKKIWTAAILAALTTTPVFAACNGGQVSEVDNGKFCISDITMNWFSAMTWCQANGMRLATIYELCPDWTGSIGSGACGRVILSVVSKESWTATTYNSEYAFVVVPSSGAVFSSRGVKSRLYPAICAPN